MKPLDLFLVTLGAVLLSWLLAWRPCKRFADALAGTSRNTAKTADVKHPIQFYYGTCGAITCDENAFPGSQRLDDDSCRYYGHRYFVCESVSRESAEIIVKAVGGVLK